MAFKPRRNNWAPPTGEPVAGLGVPTKITEAEIALVDIDALLERILVSATDSQEG